MKTYATVAADFGFVLSGLVLGILFVLMPVIYQSSLVQMQQSQSKLPSDQTAPDVKEIVLIEIGKAKAGKALIHVTSPGAEKQAFQSSGEVLDLLKRLRPQQVRLRRDREALVGNEDDIMLGLQEMKITWWLEYAR